MLFFALFLVLHLHSAADIKSQLLEGQFLVQGNPTPHTVNVEMNERKRDNLLSTLEMADFTWGKVVKKVHNNEAGRTFLRVAKKQRALLQRLIAELNEHKPLILTETDILLKTPNATDEFITPGTTVAKELPWTEWRCAAMTTDQKEHFDKNKKYDQAVGKLEKLTIEEDLPVYDRHFGKQSDLFNVALNKVALRASELALTPYLI